MAEKKSVSLKDRFLSEQNIEGNAEEKKAQKEYLEWAWEDKRRRMLVSRFGETVGEARFKSEKEAGFDEVKCFPHVR